MQTPKQDPKAVRITLLVDSSVVEQLRARADGRSLSYMVRRAIALWLEHNKTVAKHPHLH